MGILWVVLVSLFFSQANEPSYMLKKLRVEKEIIDEYCRVETGVHFDNCNKPYRMDRLDVIYFPYDLAKKISLQLEDAFSKNYYDVLSKKDLFHGHLLARGPQTTYSNPSEFFDNLELILYHSREYINNWWEDIEGDDPFVPHKQQRSFVGFFGDDSRVTAAIDLIDRTLYQKPYGDNVLRQYKQSGTVYLDDVEKSLKLSSHQLASFGGQEMLFLKTGTEGEEACEIFTMIYIMEEESGRFVSPDGKRYDIAMHCRYKYE